MILSGCLIHCWKWSNKALNYYCWNVCFSFQFFQSLLYVWGSLARFICVYICYSFLVDDPFVSNSNFSLKFYFYDTSVIVISSSGYSCTFYFYILIFYKLHITSSNISFYLVKHASDYDFFRFLYMIKSLFHLFFKVCLIYILCWRMCSFHSLMLLLCVLAYIVSIKKSAVHFIFILLYIISTPLLLYPVAFEIFPLSLILSKLIM